MLQRKCACGGTPGPTGECELCRKKREARQGTLQQKAANLEPVSEVPPIVHEVLESPGQPLEKDTRGFMESRFGHDFSQVQVHTDDKAAESARVVSARAYTVGHSIVFAKGEYQPAKVSGRKLLAHELTHIIQQANPLPASDMTPASISHPHDTSEIEASHIAKAVMDAKPTPSIGRSSPAVARQDNDAASEADTVAAPTSSAPTASTANPTVTSGGHTPAPTGMAQCPDAPPRNVVVVACTTPITAEKAVLPTPNPGRFGGDADRANFAKELAKCRAAREVKDEIEKRFRSDVASAEKRATAESKTDTEEAIKAATENVDPKDRGAVSRAKAQAAADAKKAAAKKMADAKAGITRQDVATVTSELAQKYEDELATDYDKTISGALARFGPGWLRTMQAKQDNERKRILKEKTPKPKGAKGDPSPPAKSREEIAAEVEAEMPEVRCEQKQWALDQLEAISHAWAVGRREEVDFRTVQQKVAFLKDFKPTYEVAEADRVAIPSNLQSDKKMPGVAPEVAEFLSQLAADPQTPAFTAGNYSGHGGGSWAGKGFSVDLFLKASKDQRGFWQHTVAVNFLLILHNTASALGARWRVLYNDFGVAEEVNRSTGSRNVEFMGSSGGGNLNWHGPDPLILHFHLDLEIPQKGPATENQP